MSERLAFQVEEASFLTTPPGIAPAHFRLPAPAQPR
jgi:hypothetical protein